MKLEMTNDMQKREMISLLFYEMLEKYPESDWLELGEEPFRRRKITEDDYKELRKGLSKSRMTKREIDLFVNMLRSLHDYYDQMLK